MSKQGVAHFETLINLAKDQTTKLESAFKLIEKMKEMDQIRELPALEKEVKEFEKYVLQMDKLKANLPRNDPSVIRLVNEYELISDQEMDIQMKFTSVRKKILGIEDSNAKAGNKGAMMAAALGIKIGEQGVKKTEEILATLKEANNLMDNMQGDILEQRKKLHRISDQIKQAQSMANRGREAVKYFANQASKDTCIKVILGIIALMVLVIGFMTYQISKEQEQIELSPEEEIEQNLENLAVEIDSKGNVMIDTEKESLDNDGFHDKEEIPPEDDEKDKTNEDRKLKDYSQMIARKLLKNKFRVKRRILTQK